MYTQIQMEHFIHTTSIILHYIFCIWYFQELKLHTFEASSLPELAYLLHKLAMALGLTGYCDHYQTDHPALLSRTTSENMSEQERVEGEGEGDAVPQSPPHIFHWLQSSLRGEEVCG